MGRNARSVEVIRSGISFEEKPEPSSEIANRTTRLARKSLAMTLPCQSSGKWRR
jgi:hypothetical protein